MYLLCYSFLSCILIVTVLLIRAPIYFFVQFANKKSELGVWNIWKNIF